MTGGVRLHMLWTRDPIGAVRVVELADEVTAARFLRKRYPTLVVSPYSFADHPDGLVELGSEFHYVIAVWAGRLQAADGEEPIALVTGNVGHGAAWGKTPRKRGRN